MIVCAFVMKQHCVCVEQSTGTTITYGEVIILMSLLKTSVIQQRSMRGVI